MVCRITGFLGDHVGITQNLTERLELGVDLAVYVLWTSWQRGWYDSSLSTENRCGESSSNG